MFRTFLLRSGDYEIVNINSIIWAGYTDQWCIPPRPSWVIRCGDCHLLELKNEYKRTDSNSDWLKILLSLEQKHWVLANPAHIVSIPAQVDERGRATVVFSDGSCLILEGREELVLLHEQIAL